MFSAYLSVCHYYCAYLTLYIYRGAEVSNCGRYLVISISEGCDPVNRLYFTDLEASNYEITGLLPYVKVVDNFDAEYEVGFVDESEKEIICWY